MRVIDDEFKLSFWYIEVCAYSVHNLVYLCRSSHEQQIKLVLIALLSCFSLALCTHRDLNELNFRDSIVDSFQSSTGKFIFLRLNVRFDDPLAPVKTTALLLPVK